MKKCNLGVLPLDVTVIPMQKIPMLRVLLDRLVKSVGECLIFNFSRKKTSQHFRCLEPGCQCDPTAENPDELCPVGQTCEGCRY